MRERNLFIILLQVVKVLIPYVAMVFIYKGGGIESAILFGVGWILLEVQKSKLKQE